MAGFNTSNDPLFIHPSDTPGMNIINAQLTGVENYGIWSRAMLIALHAKNKISFIDGSCQRPAPGTLSLNQWERCNALVLSWIMNTVSKEIFGGIVYSTEAFVVWTDLKEQFNQIDGSRIFALHRDIGRLSQGNSTISTYFCRLKQLWDEYGSLVVLPSCTCDTTRQYIDHDQRQRLFQFLMGLNDSFMHVRSQILLMKPLPTVSQAFSLVSQEESHRSIAACESPTSVFYSAKKKTLEPRKDIFRCDHCNGQGHTKAFCYKLVGYPTGHRFSKPQFTKNDHRKSYKDFNQLNRGHSDANVVDTSSNDNLPMDQSTPIFTPSQYAEILKLLGQTTLTSPDATVANMAGPQEWEDHGDW